MGWFVRSRKVLTEVAEMLMGPRSFVDFLVIQVKSQQTHCQRPMKMLGRSTNGLTGMPIDDWGLFDHSNE
jgi:hypothetical protein